MRKDFTPSTELMCRLIDFLYDVKTESHGWMYQEARKLIRELEEEAGNESPNTSH